MSARNMWVLEVGKIRSRLRFPRTIRLCVSCQERRSLFRIRGNVKADADHNLCFKCFRVLQDRLRARRLAGTVPGFPRDRQFSIGKETQ